MANMVCTNPSCPGFGTPHGPLEGHSRTVQTQPPQKVFTLWWKADVQVFLTREGTYEAHVNKDDDGQLRGTGKSPREAIIDALNVGDKNFG